MGSSEWAFNGWFLLYLVIQEAVKLLNKKEKSELHSKIMFALPSQNNFQNILFMHPISELDFLVTKHHSTTFFDEENNTHSSC